MSDIQRDVETLKRGLARTDEKLDRVAETLESLRIGREARLQAIENHLDRIGDGIEKFVRGLPWAVVLLSALMVIAIWLGLEGWRRP